jgi:hypothetical protein
MHEYKYRIQGQNKFESPKESPWLSFSRTFQIVFGNPKMDDATAIAEADTIFSNVLKAAKPGEVVEMTLWEGRRAVKPYGPTEKKEASMATTNQE